MYWACNTNGEKRNAYRLLVGKPEGKRPLGRQRRRWVDNIKMDLGEIGWVGVEVLLLTNCAVAYAYSWTPCHTVHVSAINL
jgi:hypothetical protein